MSRNGIIRGSTGKIVLFLYKKVNCMVFHRNSSQADLLRVAIILAQLYVTDKASRVCISIFVFELVQFWSRTKGGFRAIFCL